MFAASKTQPTSTPGYIIQLFVRTHYPSLELEPEMLEQLLWLQNNSISTSQSSAQIEPKKINIEVERILSRFYCLKLLLEGGASSYQAFIHAQSKDACLSQSSFDTLSHLIKQHSDASQQCLMATCFITKSDHAISAVPQENRRDLPADSEQFITYMVTHYPRLFPIHRLLNSEAVELLPFAFYRNAHMRQMLDIEGGYYMLSSLREGVKSGEVTLKRFNLWFARWVINIAGLDGHVNSQGSIYLTEPVAQCMFALKSEIEQLWENPNYPVLDHYLSFRMKQLNVSDRYIASLGALMRQYTPERAEEVQLWFSRLSTQEQKNCEITFTHQLEVSRMTPTFKPTVLVNLLLLGCSVSEALTLFTQIEIKAMEAYQQAVIEQRIADSTPLSYRNIAYKDLLLPLLDYYHEQGELPELIITSEGYISADSITKISSTLSK